MMHYLRHYQIIERERATKLTGIPDKTFSRIKAESEKVVLAPRKPQSNGMKHCDFDKCEICINCKITHKQDNKLYIIKKKRIVDFGFRTTNPSLLFKKI